MIIMNSERSHPFRIVKAIKNLFKKELGEDRFTLEANQHGLSLTTSRISDCKSGNVGELLQLQFVTLRMLTEEGSAVEVSDGFLLSPEDAVRLGENERLVLGLPDPWHGSFEIDIHGISSQQSFQLEMVLKEGGGKQIRAYAFQGPLLTLGPDETYLPDQAQWQALSAVSNHQALPHASRTESTNLKTIHSLKEAKKMGAALDLGTFESLEVVLPETVSLDIIEADDGNLSLVPDVTLKLLCQIFT